MILYVDTSALVPLLIDEPSTGVCGEAWDAADSIAGTRLAYIEAVAALAMAARLGRVTSEQSLAGRATLDELWSVVHVIELDRSLMSAAADLAVRHDLRGYDATHCAAAVAVNDEDCVAASGDARLLSAWRAEGIATYDTAGGRR